ncbi:MAG: hypothetical protein MK006_07405 [Pirellulales bacterium]|nr:hypothetical protein [Pirellulales bacterium]
MDSVFLSLARDDAKDLFASRDEESLVRFVSSIYEQKHGSADVLKTAMDWQGLKAALAALDDDGILGFITDDSRPLLQTEAGLVYVVRPDLVGHIAIKLNSLGDDSVTDANMASLVKELTDFYQRASENRMCTVFTTGVID